MNLFNSTKTYQLPLSRDYVRHWGYLEAIRELLQNAIDSDSKFEWAYGPGWLSITSRLATLLPSTLLLGATSKAEAADKIGSFGEGYKIALLVLAREGFSVEVRNAKRLWRPDFKWSDAFSAEQFCITDEPADQPNEGLTFFVEGLSELQLEEVVASCLQMQSAERVGKTIETTKGRVLLDHPGKLYVNGLFVCSTRLRFGYDVKPEFLKLERDRQTVSTFDLQWLTKEMWFETGRTEEIAKLIDDGAVDLEYAQHNTPELVKEACYRLFQARHPGAVIASSQKELEELIAKGMTKVVVHTSSAFSTIVKSSDAHKNAVYVRITPPAELMQEFFRAHRREMRTPAIKAFKALTELSKDWKGAAPK